MIIYVNHPIFLSLSVESRVTVIDIKLNDAFSNEFDLVCEML